MNDDHAPGRIMQFLKTKKSAFWERVRERQSLKLFHLSAAKVPAYKDFLRKNRISPSKIKTFKDFQFVQPVTKKNYLREYPLESLVWGGSLKKNKLVFTATSGSTGAPFYFPRGEALDRQSAVYHEVFLRNNDLKHDRSTLVIVGFGMGVWIGGIITYQAFKYVSEHGYYVTLLTPGANKKEILEALKTIAGKFDQVILCGYPPFIKDVVDEGTAEGIPWQKLNIKIIFAAEAFSEKFRDYIVHEVKIKDRFRNTMNVYGSADIGTMATETPVSILMRTMAIHDERQYRALFNGAELVPTLAQFNPFFINFEAVGGELFCTADNTIPLVRYGIGDKGGTSSFHEAASIFGGEKRLRTINDKFAINDTVSELPFVYVYERSDFSTKLFGAIVYPEHLKEGLLRESLKHDLTGKFKMVTKTDRYQNEYLEVNIELKPKAKATARLKQRTIESMLQMLMKKNAEYKYLYGLMANRVIPRVVFWNYGNPTHFKQGTKQRWVEKINKS